MPTFRCKLMGPEGRPVEKSLIGDSKAALKAHLEREGHFVLNIERIQGVKSLIKKGTSRRKIKTRDFFSFNQEFSVLIRSGLPIVSALSAIVEKDDESELNDIIKDIRDDISTGESLSAAFKKYSHIFSNIYVSSLYAGEKSGNIPLAISRFIEYLKKVNEIKQKVVSASVYPAILTIASVAVLTFLFVYVVPAFTQTYIESNVSLPFMTTILISISTFIKTNIIYLFLGIVLLVSLLMYAKRTDYGQTRIEEFKANLPYIGEIFSYYTTAKFCRTLSTILSGGIPLVECVKITCETIDNQYVKRKMLHVVGKIEQGAGFADSLLQEQVMPKLAIRMISAGETSGALEQVLNDVAEFYENTVDMKLTVLMTAIEPTLMAIMGVIIGFIVLAMYLPIFQLAGTVG